MVADWQQEFQSTNPVIWIPKTFANETYCHLESELIGWMKEIPMINRRQAESRRSIHWIGKGMIASLNSTATALRVFYHFESVFEEPLIDCENCFEIESFVPLKLATWSINSSARRPISVVSSKLDRRLLGTGWYHGLEPFSWGKSKVESGQPTTSRPLWTWFSMDDHSNFTIGIQETNHREKWGATAKSGDCIHTIIGYRRDCVTFSIIQAM